jgi:transcription elongation GreA/GreB family factor
MSENEKLLKQLQEGLAELDVEDRRMIEQCRVTLDSTISIYGNNGLIAMALIGLEKAAEADATL